MVQIGRGLSKAMADRSANRAEAYTSLVGGGDRLVRIIASVLALFVFDAILYRGKDPFTVLAQKKAPARIFVSYALALVVIIGALTMPEGVAVEFIYFQF